LRSGIEWSTEPQFVQATSMTTPDQMAGIQQALAPIMTA
jgi:hypothetical protein